jgi:moderate conductance mechanosensitive channel
MPTMLLPEVPAPVQVGLQLVLIALAAVAAFLVVRFAVGLMVRHLLDARSRETDDGALPEAELERRLTTIARLVVRIVGAALAVIAVLMALELFGIDIGPAVAGLGVVGIAVGFGAQTLIRDWLSGIFIVLENQYSQGDVVRIAGLEGVVEDFGLRRTSLRGLDGALHIVPNGQILVTTNLTRLWARITLGVTVSADADRDRVLRLIERVGHDLRSDADWSERLLDDPRVYRVDALPDAAVRIKVVAQVRATEQGAIGQELSKRITAALKRARIAMPAPIEVGARPEAVHRPDEESAAAGSGRA